MTRKLLLGLILSAFGIYVLASPLDHAWQLLLGFACVGGGFFTMLDAHRERKKQAWDQAQRPDRRNPATDGGGRADDDADAPGGGDGGDGDGGDGD